MFSTLYEDFSEESESDDEFTIPSLASCFVDGVVDEQRVLQRRRLLYKRELMDDIEDESFDVMKLTPTKKKRRKKSPILARKTEDGELEEILPTESLWYIIYISNPNTTCKRFQQKFRRRFRMPYSSFLGLVANAKSGNWFPSWMGASCSNRLSSPLGLMILGSLRYLGRGWTFDDCEEATAVGEETHRRFFHQFISVGSTILVQKYIHTPTTSADIEKHMDEFKLAGMPGACASSDATSIVHELCSHRLQRVHKGFKTKHPTRTYNLTVNHRREILATTNGHPGSFNDKTLVMYDEFVSGVKSGSILDDYEFELLEKRGNKIVPIKYKGVWIIVDNGYHNWSVTVPPISNSCRRDEIRWSEWLESMRKDVEVSFFFVLNMFSTKILLSN